MGTRQVNMRVHNDVVERYEDLAREHDRDRTYFMKIALERYLEGSRKPAVQIKAAMPAVSDDACEVIDYLNLRAGTRYKNSPANRKVIDPRVKEFSVQDCKTVIDKKCSEWLGTEMAKYLRPATLFQASKFEGYLNQIVVASKDQRRDQEVDDWVGGFDSHAGEVIDHEPF